VDAADDVGVETICEVAREMVWVLAEDGERIKSRPRGEEGCVRNENIETTGGDYGRRCGCFLEVLC
jgi:hypothetical protein